MDLYTLLTDRPAINALKLLYEHEVQDKSYTLKLIELQQHVRGLSIHSTHQLVQAGLVSTDQADDVIFSITDKGKHFIAIFDQLVRLSKGEKFGTSANGTAVKYALTPLEKQIIVLAQNICEGSNKEFASAQAIAQELFPEQAAQKLEGIKNYVQQLQALGLVDQQKIGKNVLVKVTHQGTKAIKEQFWKEAV